MSYKVTVSKRDDYTIYLQDINGTTWAHCDVRNWNHSVAKQMRHDIDVLYEMHGGPVLALNEPAGNAKHAKFLRMVGFSFFKQMDSDSGPQYIYKR
jgi:hypothetical protein